MEIQTPHRTRRRMGRGPGLLPWILLAVFILSSAVTAGMWYVEIYPNHEKISPYSGQATPAAYRGEMLEEGSVIVDQDEKLVSLSYLQTIDPEIHWDEASKSIVITTKDKVVRFPEQQLQAFVNEQPFSLHVPVQEVNGEKYIPMGPLENIYPIRLKPFSNTGLVVIEKHGDLVQQGKTIKVENKDQVYFIRQEPTVKAPYYTELKQGESLMIYKEEDGWYQVLTDEGYLGYIEEKHVQLTEVEQTIWEVKEREYIPWNPLGGKINLTWEHVHRLNPDHQKLPAMPGLNVISPTWFHIKNNEGDIESKASLAYVEWAHGRGYQVWALFSNNFDPDMTTAALGSFETRSKMIRQLVQYASMYKLDGINLDFENVYLKDKDNLVQFVRELTPYLHERDLVVSMDVTIKSTSERWSLFYDRARLAQTVDYMMVMTYDEHWAASPIAGSVASMPWVEKGLKGVLEDIPASKLLLGVPYYTRLWKEENGKVTSQALSMESADKWIKEKNLQPTYDKASGQNYVQHVEGGVTYKMWLEDAISMKQRAELVQKYRLAGIASWRRGFEQPAIWKAIEETFKKKP